MKKRTMEKGRAAALLACSVVGLLSGQSAFALDNLFSSSMFPDDKSKPIFSDFDIDKPATIASAKKANPAAAKKQYDDLVAHDDEEMRHQMQKVASWLQEFSLRNQNRFPGVYGSSGTTGRSAQVQLTELVGANPYANVSGYVSESRLSGLSPGLSYYYGANGTPMRGGPTANDEWTAELTADNAHRIKLQQDGGASQNEADSWGSDASGLQAEPGEICAYGNGSGFIIVWGAGADGKPVKGYDGKPYVISKQTVDVTGDVGQEAGF